MTVNPLLYYTGDRRVTQKQAEMLKLNEKL